MTLEDRQMQTRAPFGITLTLGLAAFVASAAAGCSPKDQAPYPDVASFCNAKAQAECQVATPCGIDAEGCQVLRSSLCNMEAMAALSGTRKYIQANAPACISAANAAYGNSSRDVSFAQLVGPGSISDVCARVFSGNAAINDPCESPYDCAGGNVCAPVSAAAIAPDGGVSARVCATVVAKNEGDFCGNPGETCATNTFCTQPGAGGGFRCTLANSQGQPCNPVTAPCVSTERCEAADGASLNHRASRGSKRTSPASRAMIACPAPPIAIPTWATSARRAFRLRRTLQTATPSSRLPAR